jgi:hydroxymethylbilane synthase
MIRLATRSSAQARTQAEVVAQAVTTATSKEVELVFVETLGDLNKDQPLHQIGGQGVFVKEVQQAVLRGDADIAVHSAKDLPSQATDGLVVAAWCARRDAGDALIGKSLDDLEHNATVATGSVRRRAQLVAVRPDLNFIELRGNIPTRLDKIPASGSIVMAIAALEVLGLTDRITQRLSVNDFVPMVGQGCVAVECRDGDDAMHDAIRSIDDQSTRYALEIERAFLAELGAGCSMPVGAYVDEQGVLRTFMATGPNRTDRHVTFTEQLPAREAQSFAREIARKSRSALA